MVASKNPPHQPSLPSSPSKPSRTSTASSTSTTASGTSHEALPPTPPPPPYDSDGTYTIHIGTLTGRTISLDVKSHHRVEDVKVRVYEDLGIAVDSQVLVYREKSLDDPNATLGEVGVKAGARLQLVVHMVGGPGLPMKTKKAAKEDESIVLLLCKQDDELFMVEVHVKDGRAERTTKQVIRVSGAFDDEDEEVYDESGRATRRRRGAIKSGEDDGVEGFEFPETLGEGTGPAEMLPESLFPHFAALLDEVVPDLLGGEWGAPVENEEEDHSETLTPTTPSTYEGMQNSLLDLLDLDSTTPSTSRPTSGSTISSGLLRYFYTRQPTIYASPEPYEESAITREPHPPPRTSRKPRRFDPRSAGAISTTSSAGVGNGYPATPKSKQRPATAISVMRTRNGAVPMMVHPKTRPATAGLVSLSSVGGRSTQPSSASSSKNAKAVRKSVGVRWEGEVEQGVGTRVMEAKPPSMDRPPSSSRYVRRKRAKAPPAEIRSENSTKMATTPPPLAHFRTSFNRSRPTTMMKTSQGGGGSAVAAPTRCVQCRKKLGLASTFRCRCSGWFCASHRLPESHACKFDYKVSGRMALSKENPVVKRDKLVRL